MTYEFRVYPVKQGRIFLPLRLHGQWVDIQRQIGIVMRGRKLDFVILAKKGTIDRLVDRGGETTTEPSEILMQYAERHPKFASEMTRVFKR